MRGVISAALLTLSGVLFVASLWVYPLGIAATITFLVWGGFKAYTSKHNPGPDMYLG